MLKACQSYRRRSPTGPAKDSNIYQLHNCLLSIDGVDATRRTRKEHPATSLRVIVLTTFDQDDIVLAALHAGRSGFR
jgi:DNA-binding NarL/FixJ family response regulator